jgi:Lon protease-like protein
MMDTTTDETTPFTSEELASLPVFPLPRVVFFPGTRLPLHLFEPRYRQMMEDCLTRGPRALAVVLLEEGWEGDYGGQPPIAEVAGAGRILDHARRPDGRFDLILGGVCRVRLHEHPPEEGRMYRRARGELLEDRITHPEHLNALRTTLLASASNVVTLIRQRHPGFTLGLEPDMPPGLLADVIADRLVAEPDARQRILEQLDVKVRLNHVQDAVMDLLVQVGAQEGGQLH